MLGRAGQSNASSPLVHLHEAWHRQRGRLIIFGLLQGAQDATLNFSPSSEMLSLRKAATEVNWEARDLLLSCLGMELEKAEVKRARGSSGISPGATSLHLIVALNPVQLEMIQRRALLTPDPLDKARKTEIVVSAFLVRRGFCFVLLFCFDSCFAN